MYSIVCRDEAMIPISAFHLQRMLMLCLLTERMLEPDRGNTTMGGRCPLDFNPARTRYSPGHTRLVSTLEFSGLRPTSHPIPFFRAVPGAEGALLLNAKWPLNKTGKVCLRMPFVVVAIKDASKKPISTLFFSTSLIQ